jgi:hypothetical protein
MAAVNSPYITEDDVDFGEMVLPSYVNITEKIQEAANDMDAVIGKRYRLPLVLSDQDPEHKSTVLLLKKLNRFLTIGRVVIDAAIGSEDNNLQAYGNYHLRAAESELKAIADGRTDIPGQKLIGKGETRVTGPMITNRDRVSFVDAFYNGDPWHSGIQNYGGLENG